MMGCLGSSKLVGRDFGMGWRSVAGIFSLGLAALGAGCSGGSGGSTPTANPAVTISGASQARLGSTLQLSATVTNTSNTAVTWQVNGVAGGSSATGTISATGLYTPPATIPSPNTLTITAVTQATPVASASLTESILNPIPVVTSAQATETVAGGTNYSLDALGATLIRNSKGQVGWVTVASKSGSSQDR